MKNKGKSPAMGKYMEMINEVVNNITPLYKNQLDYGGKIPSGKTPTEALMATKVDYYESRFDVIAIVIPYATLVRTE